MKLSNIVATTFFAVNALAAGVLAEKPTNLRRNLVLEHDNNVENQGHRGLVLRITFAQIVTAFQPVLAAAIEAALSAGADPLSIGATFTQELDSVVFSADCTAPAQLTLTVGDLSGLGGFVLDGLPVVDGSQQTSFSLLNGITWAASFLAEGSFPEGLELPVDATITADACGTAIDQSVSGVVDAVNAGVGITVKASGKTPGLFTLTSSSASASVSGDTTFDIGQLSTNLEFGNGIDVDLAQIVQDVLSAPAFVNQIATAIADILGNALSGLTINF